MSNETARGVFEDLVGVSDAVYSNLRGDVPAKLRIRYEDLAGVNPQIVCVSLSGFGNTGPRSAEPGYDYILQALAGWMSLTGEPDGPPTKSGLSLVDFSGGYVAATALLAAVHAARRDGIGMDCDISLYDVAVSLLNYPATWHLTAGWEPSRTERSAHPSLVPFQLFRGGDDTWFVLGCAKEKFWRAVAGVIDRPDLAEDQRFADFEARSANGAEVIRILDKAFATEPTETWLARLRAAGVPAAPVQSVPEALADPHTAARGLIIETDHPRFERVQSMASPVRVGPSGNVTYRRAPHLHEHATDVLGELLGYSTDQIRALEDRGAFGDSSTTT